MSIRFLSALVLTGMLYSAEAAEVKTAALESLVEYPQISATATVISLHSGNISAQLSANVNRIYKDVGNNVKKGDTLLSLDCSDYELAREMAEAELQSAQASRVLAANQLDRSRQLRQKELTSEQDLDSTQANYSAASARVLGAEAALQQARLNVSRCDIRAPYDGVVTARHVSVGELAIPGTQLLALTDIQSLEVAAEVSELDAIKINETTEFQFRGTENFALNLGRIVQAIDAQTRTQEIRFTFKEEKPLPGTAGKVYWQSPVPHLPPKYLVTQNGSTGFMSVEDGHARFIPLGEGFPGRSQPVDLPGETPVIIGPLGIIQDGEPVSSTMTAAQDS